MTALREIADRAAFFATYLCQNRQSLSFQLLRDLQDEFVVFEFEHRDGEALVLPRKEMVGSTEEIFTDNGVRAQGSPDMMEVWQAKPVAAASK